MVLVVKNSPANSEDIRDGGLIPGLGISPGGVHGNPLQYFCLAYSRDRGAWQAMVHRVTKSQHNWNALAYTCTYVYIKCFANMQCFTNILPPNHETPLLINVFWRIMHYILSFWTLIWVVKIDYGTISLYHLITRTFQY